MQEFRADPPVEPDTARDLVNVGADLLAQVRNLVDEGDLGRQEGVGGILDQFGCFPAREKDRGLDQVQGPVQFAHHVARARAAGADHDPVRPHEIVDCRAFAQELRVGRHIEVRVGIGLADNRLDLPPGAHRHRRLGDDDGVSADRPGDFAGSGMDVAQIGVAVAAARRRADGDKHRVRTGHCLFQAGRETQAARLDIAGDQVFEAGFVYRQPAVAQHFDSGGILVDADDIRAELGKPGGGHEADITGSDHGDFHSAPPVCLWRPAGSSKACSGSPIPSMSGRASANATFAVNQPCRSPQS